MTDVISPFQPQGPKRSGSILFKVLMIAGLIFGLLIPLNMIGGIIAERQGNKRQVDAELSQTWGPQQTMLGPVLVLPYKSAYEVTDDTGKRQIRYTQSLAYLLPEKYQVESKINPQSRYRGIYQSIVYTTDFSAQGEFRLKTLDELHIARENILWKDAFVVLGMPSAKGISMKDSSKKLALNLQGKSFELLPGMNGTSLANAGLYSPVSLSGSESHLPFKVGFSLKGSQAFSVIPIGKQNTITLTSPWTSPSFLGNPDYTLNQKGFTANWAISYLDRSYGQTFLDRADIQTLIKGSAIGVQLLTPVDSYRQSDRAIKYGVLFLVLTFATYFLFEIISRHRLHPFQYLLVGCAISLFYLLLIAISEVSSFALAYGIASLSTISAITLYSKAILGKIRRHAQWIIMGLLSILYTYLYVLLQLEDMSLLFGAIGLFIVLTIIMYVTRNIDWYNEQVNS